jgi:hypothetical protein
MHRVCEKLFTHLTHFFFVDSKWICNLHNLVAALKMQKEGEREREKSITL